MIYIFIKALCSHIPLFLLTSLLLTLFLCTVQAIVFHNKENLRRSFWLFCFIFYVQALYDVTLGISGGISEIFSVSAARRKAPNLIPFIDLFRIYPMGLKMMLKQIVLNIALMAPLGFLLPSLFHKLQSFPKTILIVLVTSFILETLQYFIGRSADIDDIIMNTIGGILGYLFFILYRKIIKCCNLFHQFFHK